jgi:hypothetical protein
MGLTASIIAAATALPRRLSAAIAEAGEPDLIVRNANVCTVDARLPRALAFAVRGSRFIAVGTNASATGDTRWRDSLLTQVYLRGNARGQ